MTEHPPTGHSTTGHSTTAWPRWWIPLLGAFAAGCLLFVLLPAESLANVVVYQAVAIGSVILLIVSIRRLPTDARGVWWAVLAYVVLSDVGDLVYDTQANVLDMPAFPGPADVLYVAAYAAALYALVLIIRRLPVRDGIEARIDTAIIALGTSCVVAVLVLEPILVEGEESTAAMALSLAYPLIDLVLISGLVRILVSRGRANAAIALVTGAFASTLVADLMFSYLAAQGLEQIVPAWLDVLYLVGFALLALAASAPGSDGLASTVVPVGAAVDARPGGPTVIALAAGALTVPLMLVYTTWFGSDADLVLLALACIVVIALVLWRFRRLLTVAGEQAADLGRLARTDALTGLANRRTLDFELERQQDVAREQGSGLCIAMLDLDRFKPYNDEFGHQAGDEALVACTQAWGSALGPAAFLARYGGEEFAALFPGQALEDVQVALEAARRATPAGLTVSIGLAQWHPDETVIDTLLRADQALYLAKERGRNRLEISAAADGPAGRS